MQGAASSPPADILTYSEKMRGKERKKPLPSWCGSAPVPVPCVIVMTLCAVMGAEHWSLHSGNILVARVDISAWLDLIRDTNTPRVIGRTPV